MIKIEFRSCANLRILDRKKYTDIPVEIVKIQQVIKIK